MATKQLLKLTHILSFLFLKYIRFTIRLVLWDAWEINTFRGNADTCALALPCSTIGKIGLLSLYFLLDLVYVCLICSNINIIPASHQEDQALRAGRREEAQGTDDSVLIFLHFYLRQIVSVVLGQPRPGQDMFQNSQI